MQCDSLILTTLNGQKTFFSQLRSFLLLLSLVFLRVQANICAVTQPLLEWLKV